jgi:peptidoglycan biosynthesis protein MviN/MurJ (putative lipid II flippase)
MGMKFVGRVRKRLRSADPAHHAIARGMAWVAFFVLVSSVARAAKEVATAYRYGVSVEVDAYLFVWNLVTWPIGIWFSVLTATLVPLATQLRKESPEQILQFRSELMAGSLWLASGLTLLTWIGLRGLFHTDWVGLSKVTLDTAIQMSGPLVLLVPLGIFIGLFSAWTLAAGRHGNTLLEGVPALVLFVVLIALTGGGTEPLVWGTIVGFGFHLIALVVPLARRGEVEMPRFSFQSTYWSLFFKGFGAMFVGQALMSMVIVVDQLFAARMEPGSIAAMSYANRILALILGLGATAVSRATLPVFAKSASAGGAQLYRMSVVWGRLLFAFGLVAVMLNWILAPWLVEFAFERGEFTSYDSVIVTEIFRYGLMQIPFYFAGMVFVSALASQGRYREIAIVSVINLFVKIMANLILLHWLKVEGVVLATSIMYAISMVLCWILVQQKSEGG